MQQMDTEDDDFIIEWTLRFLTLIFTGYGQIVALILNKYCPYEFDQHSILCDTVLTD